MQAEETQMLSILWSRGLIWLQQKCVFFVAGTPVLSMCVSEHFCVLENCLLQNKPWLLYAWNLLWSPLCLTPLPVTFLLPLHTITLSCGAVYQEDLPNKSQARCIPGALTQSYSTVNNPIVLDGWQHGDKNQTRRKKQLMYTEGKTL